MVPVARYVYPQRCICPVCDKKSAFFLPSPHKPPEFLEELGGIGGNPKSFQCAWCGSTDRERHLLMYIKASGLEKRFRNADVLHFAPEKRLYKHLQLLAPRTHLMADLYSNDKQVLPEDICGTSFDSNSFDFVIANHVLEHVHDDGSALKEILRILKPGGYAILQTPYCANLHKTWSDEGVATARAREIAYGQNDHVRVYGRDIFDRFSASGLASIANTHSQLLPNMPAQIYGVNEREPFFLFAKEDSFT